MAAHSYQLVAFDMDGTLLTSEKIISAGSKRAIAEAAAQGYFIAFASGRTIEQLKTFAAEVPEVRFAVGENGALVYDLKEQRQLHQSVLSAEAATGVVDCIAGYDVMLETFSNGQFYITSDALAHMDRYDMGIYQDLFDRYATIRDDVAAFTKDPSTPVSKINLHFTRDVALEPIMAQLKQLPLKAVYSEGTSIEITASGVSKASGLAHLCQALDIRMEQIICVGDGGNDLDMLASPALGVAMGNATPEAKRAADVIVTSNDHEGCAQVINTYLLKR